MYELYTIDTAPAGSKAALEALRERIGFVPNLAAMMGGSPVLIEGFGHLQGALRASALSGAEREVVGLTVSFANSCAYSMAAHSTFALANGLPQEVVAALRGGLPLPDPRLQVLHEFALAVLEKGGHVESSRVRAFEAAGFTTEQMFEVIAQVGYTCLANWVANVGNPPVDEPLRPQVWISAL